MKMPKLPEPTKAQLKAAERRAVRALRKWRKECLKAGIPETVLQDVLRCWDESADLPHNKHTLALRLLDDEFEEASRQAAEDGLSQVTSWQHRFLRCGCVISTVRQLMAEGRLGKPKAKKPTPSVRIRPDRRDGRKPRQRS